MFVPTFALIDPGSGGMLLQWPLGGFAGAAAFVECRRDGIPTSNPKAASAEVDGEGRLRPNLMSTLAFRR